MNINTLSGTEAVWLKYGPPYNWVNSNPTWTRKIYLQGKWAGLTEVQRTQVVTDWEKYQGKVTLEEEIANIKQTQREDEIIQELEKEKDILENPQDYPPEIVQAAAAEVGPQIAPGVIRAGGIVLIGGIAIAVVMNLVNRNR